MEVWRGHLLEGYRPGRLGKNTLFGTAGLGARAVIQAVYLLLVSRWLGAEGYGLFAGSVALVVLGAPLANWGSSLLLMRHIAEDRGSSRAILATALVQTGVIGGLLVLIVLMVSALLLPQSLPLVPVLLLALSELVLLPAAQAATSHCYALERGPASAVVTCLVPLGRTLAMLGAIAYGFAATPYYAAAAHFTGSVFGLMAAIVVVACIDGLPAWQSRLPVLSALRQGTIYAVSSVAGTSYQEVDKILMLQLLGAVAVGSYTAAFRVASIFVLPISALISATLPRLMVSQENGGKATTYRVVLKVALGYGVLAGLAILVAAPFVPLFFGPGYEDAARCLMLLAPWPSLLALRQCLAMNMTILNRQHTRSTLEVAGFILVAVLNVLLLPRMGEAAAAASLLATEIAVSAALWAALRFKKNNSSPG